jgi:tyrosyl-tRNA synthetase
MPQVTLDAARFGAGYNIVELFFDAGLVPSKSDGRRLVQQGGAFVARDGELSAITDVAALVDAAFLDADRELLLRAGKKRYCRVITGVEA